MPHNRGSQVKWIIRFIQKNLQCEPGLPTLRPFLFPAWAFFVGGELKPLWFKLFVQPTWCVQRGISKSRVMGDTGHAKMAKKGYWEWQRWVKHVLYNKGSQVKWRRHISHNFQCLPCLPALRPFLFPAWAILGGTKASLIQSVCALFRG